MDIDRAFDLLEDRRGEIITVKYADIESTWSASDRNVYDELGLPQEGFFTGTFTGAEYTNDDDGPELFICIRPETELLDPGEVLIFKARKEVVDIL